MYDPLSQHTGQDNRLVADRYRLVRELGKGSFGQVFEAEDLKFDPPRAVAIKLIYSQFHSDQDVREDIKREASILARLNHPHILRVIDFQINADIAYIVTDLAEGGSLSRQIRPDPSKPPVRTALNQVAIYLDQLAEAIDDAHSHGLVHRDIKPHNILLDRRGKVLIADFGLATVLSHSQTSTLIEVGPSGTPPYMAPEVWDGKAGKASDIYSLSILTYQLITGRLPFQGDQAALWSQHRFADPPALSLQAPDLDYPAELDAVIAGALAKDPRKRTQPAGEFARRFRQALSAPKSVALMQPEPVMVETRLPVIQPVENKTDNTVNLKPAMNSLETASLQISREEMAVRKPKHLRRSAVLVTLLLLAVVPAVLLVYAALTSKPVTNLNSAASLLTFPTVMQATSTITLVASTPVVRLSETSPVAVGAVPATATPDTTLAAPTVLPVPATVTPTIQSNNVTTVVSAVRTAALTETPVMTLPASPTPPLADSKTVFELINQLKEADKRKDLDKTIELGETVLRLDSSQKEARSILVMAYFSRGNIAFDTFDMGKIDLALRDFNKVLEFDPNFPNGYNSRGDVYFQQKKYDLALQEYSMAIKVYSEYTNAYSNRGNVYRLLKQYDPALKDFERSLQLNPKHVRSYERRGLLYYENQQYDLALNDFNKGIEVDPKYGPTYARRGRLYLEQQKQFDLAIKDLDQAISLNPLFGENYRLRGLAYKAKGNKEAARRDFEKALNYDPNDEIAKQELKNI